MRRSMASAVSTVWSAISGVLRPDLDAGLGLGRDRRRRQPRLAGLEDEGVVEAVPGALHVGVGGRFVLVQDVMPDQGAGDAELGVGLQVLVVLAVDLRRLGLEAG